MSLENIKGFSLNTKGKSKLLWPFIFTKSKRYIKGKRHTRSSVPKTESYGDAVTLCMQNSLTELEGCVKFVYLLLDLQCWIEVGRL